MEYVEKLYRCKILKETGLHPTWKTDMEEEEEGRNNGIDMYDLIENFEKNSEECDYESEEPNEIHYTEIMNYTDLYKRFKEKNGIKTYNKWPIHPYKHGQVLNKEEWEELKKEVEEEKREQRKKEKQKKNPKKDNNAYEDEVIHPTELTIYTPNKLFHSQKGGKSLRQKIYDGEMMFYEDYIEQVGKQDYEYFFKKKFKEKRKDEGGNYYFYGKKLEMNSFEDIYRKYYNLNDEYFIHKMINKEKEQKEFKKKLKEQEKARKQQQLLEQKDEHTKKMEKEYESLNNKEKSIILKLKEENDIKNASTYTFYKKNKHIIFNKNLSDTKKKELLNGTIPDIILPITARRTKNPKNCTVPFNRLNNYAHVLENFTRCPYIHIAMEAELMKNWKSYENPNIKKLRTPKDKKGYKKDIYIVTKEQLEKSKEKLKNILQKDVDENEEISKDLLNMNKQFEFKKQERVNKVVSGGRYNI